MTSRDLQHILKANDLSVKQFATLVGCSERAVYYWLEGDRKIPRYLGRLIALGGLKNGD